MKKYWIIIKNECQRQLTFRADIAFYIGGNIFELLAQVVIWTAIFKTLDAVKGYTYQEMMSYVVIGWFFMFLTSNYDFESNIAKDIHLGSLSNFLTKPISYLRYMTAKSFGRITIAFLMIIIQTIFYLLIFYKYMVFSISPITLIILLLMLVCGYFIKLYFAFLVGIIAFWTTDVSGVQYAFNVIIKFLSGAFFPIILLPDVLVKVSMFFPFVYTFFIPVQLYLGKITILEGLQGVGVQLIWLVLLYFIVKAIWRVGLKKYEGVGV